MSALKDMRVLIIGLGLIGGSVARGLRSRGLCKTIDACGRDPKPLQLALEDGVIDAFSADLGELVPDADLIMIAVPTLSVSRILSLIQPLLREHTIVTDAASVKGSVIHDLQAVFGKIPPNFVPGHPIAGSERSGYEASNELLFTDRQVILTPLVETDTHALRVVQELWQGLGAQVSNMSVQDHDAVLAATSHLPHLLAYSLVNTLSSQSQTDDIFRYAAGGFAGFTRIAGSDPVMWRDIFLANGAATIAVLDAYTDELARMRTALVKGDSEVLEASFITAKNARTRFVRQYFKPEQSSSLLALVPVLTIDGPGGSGKGTISAKIAQLLGWHYLDSGALYRLLGVAAHRAGISTGDATGLLELLERIKIRFEASDGGVWLGEDEVSTELRQEAAGTLASEVAVVPAVRQALLARQHQFRQLPGLVADGRDMGTVVFPDAIVKVFLTASPQERANRRYKQLIAKGIDVNLSALFLDIKARDERDSNRAVSPLKPADDAIVVDTTDLSIEQVVATVLELVRRRMPIADN